MLDARPPAFTQAASIERGDVASRRFHFLERYMLAKQAKRDKQRDDLLEFTDEPPNVVSPIPKRQTSGITCLVNVCEQARLVYDAAGLLQVPHRNTNPPLPPKKRKHSAREDVVCSLSPTKLQFVKTDPGHSTRLDYTGFNETIAKAAHERQESMRLAYGMQTDVLSRCLNTPSVASAHARRATSI